MKCDLYLIRHARTEWNQAGKIQGTLNSSLSQEGIEQARNLGKTFKTLNPDIICTSALGRTQQTAQIAMEEWGETREIQKYEGLNEMHLSSWQGMNFEDIKNQFPEKFDKFLTEPHKFFAEGELPGSENYFDVQKRVVNSIEEIMEKNPCKKIAVISHGIVLRVLLSHIRNIPFELSNRKVNIAGNAQIFHTTWIK